MSTDTAARFGPRVAPNESVCPVCGREGCEDPTHVPPEPEPERDSGGIRESSHPTLEFLPIRDLASQVDAAGPRRWLLRGIWPAGDYGVHAAEMKAQKTWTTCDLVVAVASGQPWLGHVAVDDAGPVLMFVGEGGRANTVRRLRAVCEARGVVLEDLPIVVCARAPHLSAPGHIILIERQIAVQQPRLVTLDPFYLAARGAKGADLYAMGGMLETAQLVCQDHGAALWLTTHFNRQQGRGALRISGAGPAEWGRVLITATVQARHTDPVTKATRVVTELEIIGGEIPDQTLRVQRRIWADNPEDLSSPLHVEVTVHEAETTTAPDDPLAGMSEAARKLYASLQAANGHATSSAALVDWIAQTHGHGLRRETVSRQLNELERRGLVVSQEPIRPGSDKLWRLTDEGL